MNLPMPLHGGAMRPAATAGSVPGSMSRRRARLSGDSAAAVMSGSRLDRSRTCPLVSTSAGLSAPLGPWRINFMNSLLGDSVGPTAVDDLGGAGGEARFVGREVHRQRGDLLGLADPADGLARDEGGLHRLHRLAAGSGLRLDALCQRRRLHGAGA